jgi:hypothetical protein
MNQPFVAVKDLFDALENTVLTTGEKVIWRGRPSVSGGVYDGIGRSLLGLLMLVFILVAGPIYYTVFGELFWIAAAVLVAQALYNCAMPLVRSVKASRTRFVVTNRRVVIFERLFTTRVTNVFPSGLSRTKLNQGTKERGSINLFEVEPALVKGWKRPYGVVYRRLIWNTADVQGAYDAILALQDTAAEPSR